ncbi:MAG: FAD binding domain-containing protein [Firmicutes bacterium]|nr:FAD binding domain-containing protein [Bacillota bacterium]
MIPFNFTYCRPSTEKEAADAFAAHESEGKTPLYYAGGSEIITMCRTRSISPGCVIDIKNIPNLNLLSVDGNHLIIGTANTLTKICQSKLFPLLKLACGRIADHTNQCRITLGGNICGSIIYRETVLPLLLSDADITLFGPNGGRSASVESIFRRRLARNQNEMITQVRIPIWALDARHAHIKKTANEKIDYPLISVAALWKGETLRVAFSGLCSYPFRSKEIESVLNDRAKSIEERAQRASELLPEQAYNDSVASSEYRLFVLKNTLEKLLEGWENDSI